MRAETPLRALTQLNREAQRLSRDDQSDILFYVLPAAQRDGTLLYILQGSDCNSVLTNDAILSGFRQVWPAADLLLIEKYGINRTLAYSADAERPDCPAGTLRHDHPQQRLTDSMLVLNQLMASGAYQRLIILGGSEGAVIANLISAQRADIAATIVFNGGGRRFIDDVLHSIKASVPEGPERTGAINGFMAFANSLDAEPIALRPHKSSPEKESRSEQKVANKQKDEGASEQSAHENTIVSGHGIHWWQQMLALDQQSILQSVDSPVLIIQSQQDKSVAPEQVDLMLKALTQAGKNNIHYRMYPELDHQLKKPNGLNNRAWVINDISGWLTPILQNTPAGQ
ncbi:prolyl oligopeptidase family serine peptidase [Thalassolituus sp. LLYu03]|uniref:prolyl oligopeptidase family serine peptidase n=1 Tax=Thalassolituus sp. LLYu03 TaxID=3421656 RepID=UPI003D2AAF60